MDAWILSDPLQLKMNLLKPKTRLQNSKYRTPFWLFFWAFGFFFHIFVRPKHQFSSCYIDNPPGVYLLRGVYPSYKSLSLFKAAKLTVSLMWDFNLTDVWGWEHSGDRDHSFIHTLMAPICVWIISYHHSSVPLSVGAATLSFHSLQRENRQLIFSARNSQWSPCWMHFQGFR